MSTSGAADPSPSETPPRRYPSITGPAETCRNAPRRSLRSPVLRVFDNRDYDDGGYRTELTVTDRGKDVTVVVDVRTDLRLGETYTFFVVDEDGYLHVSEIREGEEIIWDSTSGMALSAGVSFTESSFVVTAGDELHAFPATSSLRDAKLEPHTPYIVEIFVTESALGSCERLLRIGEQDTTRTVEVLDPRMGKYRVPAVNWRWEAQAAPAP